MFEFMLHYDVVICESGTHNAGGNRSPASLERDLRGEQDAFDELILSLEEQAWDQGNAAPGWDVRDQVAHLAVQAELALFSATQPIRFAEELARALQDSDAYARNISKKAHSMPVNDLYERWRSAESNMVSAFSSLDAAQKLPWFGLSISSTSLMKARLMELWAHGQDIADGFSFERVPSDRLFHVAELGAKSRAYSYAIRGRTAPAGQVHISLRAPSGTSWVWGNPESLARVNGPAIDFCFVVTRRRRLSDVDLDIVGDEAAEWLDIAQAFGGPPSPEPPAPRSGG